MQLNSQQKQTIIEIDQKVKYILASNGNEVDIFLEFATKMPIIKQIMETKEIDLYFQEYEGFYYYMKLLENLAQGLSDGSLKVPSDFPEIS